MPNAIPKKTKSRGTNDELEILKEIIIADQELLEKVFRKIRSLRATKDVGIIQEMSNKTTNSNRREKMAQKK